MGLETQIAIASTLSMFVLDTPKQIGLKEQTTKMHKKKERKQKREKRQKKQKRQKKEAALPSTASAQESM